MWNTFIPRHIHKCKTLPPIVSGVSDTQPSVTFIYVSLYTRVMPPRLICETLVYHDTYINVTLGCVSDTPDTIGGKVSHIWVMSPITSHSNVWLDPVTCVTWLIYTRHVRITWRQVSQVWIKHISESCHTYECGTGRSRWKYLAVCVTQISVCVRSCLWGGYD